MGLLTLPRLTEIHNLPGSTSQIAGITGMCHQALLKWNSFLAYFIYGFEAHEPVFIFQICLDVKVCMFGQRIYPSLMSSLFNKGNDTLSFFRLLWNYIMCGIVAAT
jgi:hypothetical protein